MDSLTGYRRASAIGWRSLVAVAAVLAATSAVSSGHSVTALVLGLAALLAVADIGFAAVHPAARPPAPPADVGAAREADRLRALLDAVSAALFVLDTEGRIVLANRAARSLAGADVARLDDVAVLGPAAAAAVRALTPGVRRIVRARDGRSLLAWSGAFNAPGEAPQRLLSLQWVAGELDAVETEAWLAMTRVLTHEMMNSLTPIVSLAESVIALPERSAAVTPALATIARRAAHLVRFIERYRALGDLPRPNLVSFDLAALLAEIVQTMEPEFIAGGIEASLRIDRKPRTMTADPDLLERAVINLLRNATEALQNEEQSRLEVDLSASPAGVTIAIRDNGPGIPLDRLDDVFVPFFSTKPAGSGIGLPLARQIASLHGGSLIARPTACGSCFELHLPNAVPSRSGEAE